jgi:DnaJ like chaperone protein
VDIPKKLKYNPLFGFGLVLIPCLILSGNFLAAAFLGFLGAYVQMILVARIRINGDGPREGFLKSEQDYLKNIFALAAAVIKADGKDDVHELAFIESKLRKDFSAGFVPVAMSHLRAELRSTNHLKTHTDLIADEFDNAAKIQLMHFLVNICTADGVMTNAERKMLFEISARIEFSPKTLEAIIAMFRFRTEHQQSQAKTVSPGALDNAYKILQVSPTATDKEIKKAYKKLAILHHPDKAAHLGEQLQKAAAEKFKIIAGAYDLICKKRGIV